MSSFFTENKIEKLYPSQQPGEKIMLVVREHWFLLTLKFLVIVILAIIPIVINILMAVFSVNLGIGNISTLLSVGLQVYYLGLLLGALVIFIIYYLNVYIVSDQRIVDIDQVGLLFREVSELNIETIEDVTGETKGFFGNLLDYGTVFIQTAGARDRFEFTNVPNPNKVSSLILHFYEEHGKKEFPKP